MVLNLMILHERGVHAALEAFVLLIIFICFIDTT